MHPPRWLRTHTTAARPAGRTLPLPAATERNPRGVAVPNTMTTVVARLPVIAATLCFQAVAGDFDDLVQPLLSKHCIACHGQQMQMAELRLDQFQSEPDALRYPGIWDDVLRTTTLGKMPPPGSLAPTQSELESLAEWIESNRSTMELHRTTQARRVTARRLNRAEYNNTVRDLLGIDGRPADAFPVDDSGYGFDNIADVLSISPLLMEKYIAAAGKLARAAVWDKPRSAEPTRFRIQAARDESNSAAIGRISPFTADGSIQLSFEFPAAGFYEFAFGAIDRRQRSEEDGRYLPDMEPPPPRLMTMRLDGSRMATKAVEAAQYFDRSERVTHRIEPGTVDISVGFIDQAGNPMDPNTEYSQRKLWVDYLEINGPFDAEPLPLPASHRRLLVCRPDGEEPWEPCARRIIERLTLKSYRRPPTQPELQSLMRLAERSMRNGESFEGMIQTVLQSVLVSPQFLFRIERSPEQGSDQPARELNDFELASRLSYFLWSSMPDDALFEAAAGGSLRSAEALRREARRMLANPRSSALVENFAGQWLQLRNLMQAQPDAERFPTFDEELRESMLRESELFFDSVVREDRSILDFLDSDFTFVNEALARHYGIGDVSGAEFRRVEIPNEQRGGLLGQASLLTISSYPTRTSPVLRGLWVLENLLGQSPPPPPPDVPELDVQEGPLVGTLREQLEEHRSNAGCMSCHRVMDAIGFGLENYDATGKWRERDGDLPLDTSGTLPGDHSFQSPAELRKILVNTEAQSFSRTLAKKLLTYALGRGVDRHDNPAVDEIQRQLVDAEYRFSALVEAIVSSKPFRLTAPDRTVAGEDL